MEITHSDKFKIQQMKLAGRNTRIHFLTMLIFLFSFSLEVNAQATPKKDFYQNPILGGDYPDPSVLRVGKDYYMTHSSFDYYPGLLIWHSTDLVHWERVAYA